MPLFAVHALDRPNALAARLEHYPAHRSFVEGAARDFGVEIVMSGPLQSDDGEIMIGSLFIVDAADRATISRFIAADPFQAENVWGEVTITRFQRRKG